MLPPSLVPARALWTALVLAQFPLAALIVAGVWARPSLALAGVFQLYALGCDRNAYHHHLYTFALVLLLCALTPCDRALAWRRENRDGPLWALRLVGLQLAVVYLASGASKLADADWRTGRVIADGVLHFAGAAVARGVPERAVAFFADAAVAALLAKLAIATELALACLPFCRRWRAPLLWLGVMFHGCIQLITTVGIFSVLMLLGYLAFVRPELEERTLILPRRGQRRLAAALDWLRRFRITPGERFTVVDREGRAHTGRAALAELARATPLLFPLWPLLRLVALI
jgi:hypothetical protein